MKKLIYGKYSCKIKGRFVVVLPRKMYKKNLKLLYNNFNLPPNTHIPTFDKDEVNFIRHCQKIF